MRFFFQKGLLGLFLKAKLSCCIFYFSKKKRVKGASGGPFLYWKPHQQQLMGEQRLLAGWLGFCAT
jgi:hypothetical protein